MRERVRMRDFKKIIAWQKAQALSVSTHAVAGRSALSASPGLRAQLLEAVKSVAANIAEGSGARTDAEFTRYLDIAFKSASETENHLLEAAALGCMAPAESDQLLGQVDEAKAVLYSFTRSVRRRAGLE